MHDRVAGCLEGRNLGVLRSVGRAFEPNVGKDAVVAVDLRRSYGLAVHRGNSLAQLAGGFGDQLLQPRTQVVDFRRSEDGDLVDRKSTRLNSSHLGISYA